MLVTALHARACTWQVQLSHIKNVSLKDSSAEDQLRMINQALQERQTIQRPLKEIHTSDFTVHVGDAVKLTFFLFSPLFLQETSTRILHVK